jgi:hypothetical protein
MMDKYKAVLMRTDCQGNTKLINTIAFAWGHTSGLYFKYVDLDNYDYQVVSIKKVQGKK